MKPYVISLARSKERSKYIEQHMEELSIDYNLVEAVDGSLLSNEDIIKECDIDQVNKLRWWLTNGAIGCALSHKSAYKKFLSTNESSAFIIEDDVVLPNNIIEIVDQVSKKIKSNEVILLYYTSFESGQLSKVKSVQLNNSKYGLFFPMDVKHTMTAAAYCIGREAAINILNLNTPIVVTADCWHYFFSNNGFESLRVLYPSPISTKNFKSSIDYHKKNSLTGWFSYLIDRYKIPILFQYVRIKRGERLKSMLNRFSFTETESPISHKISIP